MSYLIPSTITSRVRRWLPWLKTDRWVPIQMAEQAQKEMRMTKQCVFYYATIVKSDYQGAPVGARQREPMFSTVGPGPKIGREPDYCCENMKEPVVRGYLYGLPDRTPPALVGAMMGVDTSWLFCPFCGAEIVFREDLKVRAVSAKRTIDELRFEEETHP